MEAAINETVPQEIGPILQLNRPLLPIGEYADREGITKGLIEECGRLGIVPIRRYKGKTFVVDVPIHSYSDKYEIIGAPVQVPDKTTRPDKISKPPEKPTYSSEIDDMLAKFAVDIDKNGTVFNSIQKDFPERLEIADEQTVAIDNEIELTEEIAQLQTEADETVGRTTKPPDDTIGPDENIFQSIQTQPPKSPEVADEPMTEPDRTARPETPPDVIQTPELQTSEIIDDLPDFADEVIEIQKAVKSIQNSQEDERQIGILAAQARSKRTWQFAAVFSLVCFFASVLASLWFYTGRRTQLERLNQAYASIETVYAYYTQADKNAETIRNELDMSRTQVERIQTELDKSTAEIQKVRYELAQAKQNFHTTGKYNVEGAEKLNKEIQELATRLANLTKNP
jgi:peptidoglycan hydrolase CwlO-like protein